LPPLPSSALALLSDRLMAPAKGRPRKAEAEALWGLCDGEQQATDLRYCQRQ
jgi:hypothetical protein